MEYKKIICEETNCWQTVSLTDWRQLNHKATCLTSAEIYGLFAEDFGILFMIVKVSNGY